ncbi:phosphoglycerate mutase-like protein [Artomyces pyxidatus]|uniref:Phosphoglycerate mutase-like protein n=1 Tax=Artomyces pyxidatus TaxID=48021 RepID=A0ACB8T5J6_9AGAM|nr:phosphoglycerate mutase-like protein [Artomyces pyxidatus]
MAVAMARVYIVRHGETDENRQAIIQGQFDSHLNAKGIEQGKRVAEALRAVPFTAAFTSDLVRASKTAEYILEHHPGVPLRKQTELRERYMGELQGKKYGAKMLPPGESTVESIEAMSARTARWWADTVLALPRRSEPQCALVVSHGGFIGVLVKGLLNKRVRLGKDVQMGRCLNTSVSIVEIMEDGRGVLVQYADISHLAESRKEVVQGNADEQGLRV